MHFVFDEAHSLAAAVGDAHSAGMPVPSIPPGRGLLDRMQHHQHWAALALAHPQLVALAHAVAAINSAVRLMVYGNSRLAPGWEPLCPQTRSAPYQVLCDAGSCELCREGNVVVGVNGLIAPGGLLEVCGCTLHLLEEALSAFRMTEEHDPSSLSPDLLADVGAYAFEAVLGVLHNLLHPGDGQPQHGIPKGAAAWPLYSVVITKGNIVEDVSTYNQLAFEVRGGATHATLVLRFSQGNLAACAWRWPECASH